MRRIFFIVVLALLSAAAYQTLNPPSYLSAARADAKDVTREARMIKMLRTACVKPVANVPIDPTGEELDLH